MRLLHLRLEQFRSHDELEIDLDGVQTAAITGRNGAGKTSILLAIEYALFGGNGDDLLRHGAKLGGVTLDFDLEGVRWRVARGRERGKRSWLIVERDGQSIGKHTIAQAQDFIIDVVGMDEEAFQASVYAPQGQAGVLASMTPGDRKALLGGLLGLDSYEDWRSAASTDSRALGERIEVLGESIHRETQRLEDARAKASLAEAYESQIATLTRGLAKLDGQIDEAGQRAAIAGQVRRRADLVAQAQTVKTEGKKAKERNARRRELRDQLNTGAGTGQEVDRLRAERDEHQRQVATMQAAHASYQERVTAAGQRAVRANQVLEDARGRLAKLSARAEALRESPPPEPSAEACPTCGQEIHGEAAQRVRADYEAQLLRHAQEFDQAAQEAQRAAQALPALEAEAQAADAAQEVLEAPPQADLPTWVPDALRRAEEAWRVLTQAEGQLQALGADEDVAALKKRWEELLAEARELPTEVPAGPTIEELRAQRAPVASALEQARASLAAATASAEEAKRLEESIAQAQSDVDRDSERRRALDTLAKACSRSGIPAMILDNATSGIESAANDVLERLGSSLRLRLVTEQAKRSGKGTKETLEIMVDDGAFERPIASFSGGERYRVHVALRMGLAAMLSAGSGVPCDVFILDEPTDLDHEGVAMLADILTRLDAQVLLVSHQEELIGAMPQKIQVERSSDASPSKVTIA